MYAWLDDALAASDSHVITANRRLARELRRAWGERQMAAGRTAWPTPEIRYINDWISELADALPPAERLPTLLENSPVLIMTTHSPVMLKTVQRIIALDGGRVVADGPREKLVTLPTENIPGT